MTGKVTLSDEEGRGLKTPKQTTRRDSPFRTPQTSRTVEETGSRTRKTSRRTYHTPVHHASSPSSAGRGRETSHGPASGTTEGTHGELETARVLQLEVSDSSHVGVEGDESSSAGQSDQTATPTASDDMSTTEADEVYTCTCNIHVIYCLVLNFGESLVNFATFVNL